MLGAVEVAHADPNATSDHKALACAVVAQAVDDLTTTRTADRAGETSVERVRDEAISFFTSGGDHAFMRNHWFSLVGLDEETVYDALRHHMKGHTLTRYISASPTTDPEPIEIPVAPKPPKQLTPDEKDELLLPLFQEPSTVTGASFKTNERAGEYLIRKWVKEKIALGVMEPATERHKYVVVQHLKEAA